MTPSSGHLKPIGPRKLVKTFFTEKGDENQVSVKRSQLSESSTKMALAIFMIIVLLAWFFTACSSLGTRSSLQKVPGPPGRPIVGHLFELLRPSYHRTLFGWCQLYGDVYKINVLGVQGLVVSCPKVISQLLGQERGTPGLPKLSAYDELNMVRLASK